MFILYLYVLNLGPEQVIRILSAWKIVILYELYVEYRGYFIQCIP